ncbi:MULTISPECIES: PAS domain-containing protein [unclassified Duganella]|uniref:PAS domain-containing protein n=1 Tax=unclassified Duganella TaxID=2636909 RepID=UPI001E35B92C|nr:MULTISPECIES: PAS domain-containing protein [unclassified Duganella]
MPAPSRRLPSIRSQIALLVLACALPTVIGFGAVVAQFYQRERDTLMEDTGQAARLVAAAIDRDLLQGESAARALAGSPSLQSGDLGALRSQAAALLGPQFPAAQFLLSDASGRIALQVGAPLPAALAAADNRRRLAPLYAHDRVQLSLVGSGANAQLAIDVPVRVDRRLAYALTALLKPERLAYILRDENVGRHQAMSLFDSEGVIVTQAGAPHQLLGAPAEAALRARLQANGNALLATAAADGTPIYLGFSRSPVSRAIVAIATPQDQALHELLNAVTTISLAMAALLLAGFSLAWWVGGRIAGSVRALVGPAQALAGGSPFTLGAATFREAGEVGQAFRALELDLRRNQAQLEQLVAERTAQLEKSRAQLETLYATAPVGLSYVDSQLRFVRLNDYLAALNDQPVSAHLGRHVGEMIPDAAVRRGVLADYRTVLDSGRPLTGLQRSGHPAASPNQLCHWVLSYYPQFGTDGRIAGITALLMDVSELKRTEAELRRSRQLMGSVLENMPAMIFLKRAADLRYDMFNRYGAQLFGRAGGEEFIGKCDYDFVPAAQADSFAEADRRVLAAPPGEVAEIAEEPVTGAGGGTRYMTTRKVALRDEHGAPTHVLGISIDITERKEAKEALRATVAKLAQSEHFVRTVADNLPGMVAYWDAGQRCRFANRYFLDWHGRDSAQMLDALMPEVMGEAQYAVCAPYVQGALAGQPQAFADRLRWPSGELSHTWVNYIPDIDERGAVRGFFVLVSDVTELKEAELHLQEVNEELVLARDRAEAASRAKSEFLANMSHEIRTPMNAIIGLARLLEQAALAPREREQLDKIQLATQSLLGLVNDVLDYSRIDAGQLVLDHAGFSLERILDSVGLLVSGAAGDKGIELVYDIDPRLPAELAGDPMRLEQVLLNLVGNAVKFTERGEVVLQVRAAAGADLAGRHAILLEFRVRDTGVGIPAAQQARIFDAFSQADGSSSRQFGGAGLGLAICRQLADMMGGAISVSSEPGGGSEFLFSCPFECGAPLAAPVPPPAAAGLALLIVDDNASAREALQLACNHLGWAASCAAGADAALAMLRERRHRPYDLLLLDYHMPDGDAATVLARLRAGMALPPVLLMAPEPVAAGQAGLAEGLGVAGVLSKPVLPARLLERVAALFSGAPGAAPSAPHGPLDGQLNGLRILLVEDNEINQEVAQLMLLHAGAAVETVANGQLAVDLLCADPQRCDLVLMDVQMPVLNGYDATAAIRAAGGPLARLPIVAMTANVMEDDRRRADQAGMDAHVAKPIDVAEMIAVLTRLVPRPAAPARSTSAAMPLAAPAAARDAPRPSAPPGAMPAAAPGVVPGAMPAAGPARAPAGLLALPGVDTKAALARLGGNSDALVALFKRFEQTQGATVTEVRAQLAAGHRQQAAQSLHRLRGVAANLGATQVAGLTAEAEAILHRDHPDPAALDAALTVLDQALQGLAADARRLSVSTDSLPQGKPIAHDLPQKLAELHSLLQNNNLKALDVLRQLRPALTDADGWSALAEAVETLDFTAAQAIVADMLHRKDSA